jgi:hypothetical protein
VELVFVRCILYWVLDVVVRITAPDHCRRKTGPQTYDDHLRSHSLYAKPMPLTPPPPHFFLIHLK